MRIFLQKTTIFPIKTYNGFVKKSKMSKCEEQAKMRALKKYKLDKI